MVLKLSDYKKHISIAVMVIIAVLFINYIYTHISDFKQLTIANPLYILPLLILVLLNTITNGIIIKLFLKPFNINIKFKEWFGLSIVTSFYNTITPLRGGAFVKAIYLKKRYNFSYLDFLASFSGVYVITILMASFTGLISLIFLYTQYNIFNPIVLAIFLAFFIPLSTIVLFSPEFPKTKNNFINNIVRILNGWNLIRKNRKTVFLISLIALTQIVISIINTIIAYGIFDIKITLIQALFLVSLGLVSMVISITPGSLGIAEAVSVFSALVIGITPAQSLTVALFTRAVSLLVILTLGPLFSYILLRNNKNEKPQRKPQKHNTK